jgi:hypothetical protein
MLSFLVFLCVAAPLKPTVDLLPIEGGVQVMIGGYTARGVHVVFDQNKQTLAVYGHDGFPAKLSTLRDGRTESVSGRRVTLDLRTGKIRVFRE